MASDEITIRAVVHGRARDADGEIEIAASVDAAADGERFAAVITGPTGIERRVETANPIKSRFGAYMLRQLADANRAAKPVTPAPKPRSRDRDRRLPGLVPCPECAGVDADVCPTCGGRGAIAGD